MFNAKDHGKDFWTCISGLVRWPCETNLSAESFEAQRQMGWIERVTEEGNW